MDSNESLKNISEKLESIISETIISTLHQRFQNEKIAYVKLYYRSLQWYLPLVPVITQKQLDNFCNSSEYDPEIVFNPVCWPEPPSLIEVEYKNTEPEYSQFLQIMEDEDKWDVGTKMLHEACRRITETIRKSTLPIGENFVCYVLDDEFEFPEEESILIACGATEEQIKRWNEKGWMYKAP